MEQLPIVRPGERVVARSDGKGGLILGVEKIQGFGFAASAELNAPFPFRGSGLFGTRLAQRVKLAAFLGNAEVVSPKTTSLTGAGGGLIVGFSRYLEGRVYLGTPLTQRTDFKHLQVHFALQATPRFPELLRKLRH